MGSRMPREDEFLDGKSLRDDAISLGPGSLVGNRKEKKIRLAKRVERVLERRRGSLSLFCTCSAGFARPFFSFSL